MNTPSSKRGSSRKRIAGLFAMLNERESIDRDAREYSTRSNKVADAFRQKLIDKVATLAGLTPEVIRKRQVRHDQADRRFLETMKARFAAAAAKAKVRQDTVIARFREHPSGLQLRSGSLSPNDLPPRFPVYDILSKADLIEMAPFGAGSSVDFTSSIAPWRNDVRIRLNGGQRTSHAVAISFNWTPPRDGLLNVVALLAASGSHWWAVQHGCSSARAYQSVGCILWIVAGNPPQYECSVSAGIMQKSADNYPGCGSDIGLGVIDEVPVLVYDRGFPVKAGETITIAVVVHLINSAHNANSEVDFSTFSKRLSVPGIVLYMP